MYQSSSKNTPFNRKQVLFCGPDSKLTQQVAYVALSAENLIDWTKLESFYPIRCLQQILVPFSEEHDEKVQAWIHDPAPESASLIGLSKNWGTTAWFVLPVACKLDDNFARCLKQLDINRGEKLEKTEIKILLIKTNDEAVSDTLQDDVADFVGGCDLQYCCLAAVYAPWNFRIPEEREVLQCVLREELGLDRKNIVGLSRS